MNNINRAVAELLEKNRQFFDGKPIAFDGVQSAQAGGH